MRKKHVETKVYKYRITWFIYLPLKGIASQMMKNTIVLQFALFCMASTHNCTRVDDEIYRDGRSNNLLADSHRVLGTYFWNRSLWNESFMNKKVGIWVLYIYFSTKQLTTKRFRVEWALFELNRLKNNIYPPNYAA